MASNYNRIVATELKDRPATRSELYDRVSLERTQIDSALGALRKAGKLKKDARGKFRLVGQVPGASPNAGVSWYADIKAMGWLAQQPRFGAERINDYWQRIE